MTVILDLETPVVKPITTDACFKEVLFDLIAASWDAHMEQKAEDAHYDELVEEAAMNAAYELACEVGYLPC